MELTGPPGTIRNAKRLRREMTLPEILLWQALRQRPAALKFRKQHPAGPYVLDFYCDAIKLAVEVDGAAHGHGDRPDRDAQRDAWLAIRNVRVLRVNASDVLTDLDAVVRQIVDTARG
ncbi:MAG: endonuclease domain-containing protein [Sphingomonas sp.]